MTPCFHQWQSSSHLIKTDNTHSSIRSDEGLTLELSTFLIFHGGNATFINSFDKTKFLYENISVAKTVS